MAPIEIADWLTGCSFAAILAELLYLKRRRSEFRFCWQLKIMVSILAVLTAAMIAEFTLGHEVLPNLNELRVAVLSVFSLSIAAWLMMTVRKIEHMPRLAELEEMVQERTVALQSIVDNCPIAIVQVDTEGLVTMWNRASEELFGWKTAEILGQPLPIIPDIKLDEYRRNLSDTLTNKANLGTLTQRKHKDGRLIDVRFWNAPLRSGRLRENRAMGLFIDMRTENALTESLKQAKAQAERANEAKSRFLAYMSHEIRTPLSAIVGFGEVLLDNGLSEEQRHNFLETMVRNGRSLAILIDDILDISKVEAGEMRMHPLPVSVREILKDISATLELKAVDKGLTLQISVSDRVPGEVTVDGDRLRQIIMNVAGNAVKFTNHGGIYISADHADGRLKITVRDTGQGMSTEQQRKLFQPFEQTDDSVSCRYGGTGLGLFLSRKLSKLMDGHLLLASSAPDRGSVFEIEVAAPEAPQAQVEFSTGNSPGLGRILNIPLPETPGARDGRARALPSAPNGEPVPLSLTPPGERGPSPRI